MTIERRIRIGDWLVPYDDATQEVTLQRTLTDILKATPGDHMECMNSLCIKAHRRDHVFPHPVLLVSTILTCVYVVDRLDEHGDPAHAIRYGLGRKDSRLIHEHDHYGSGEPGVLRLRIPRDPKGSPLRAQRGNRFADGGGHGTSPGTQYGGETRRPVTSIGAKGRFRVAVGALRQEELS